MEKQKLAKLTSKYEKCQRNGKYSECIEIMKQIINLNKSLYGKDDQQVQKAEQKLCEQLNFVAMVELQKQQLDSAIDHLRQAQQFARSSPSLKAITYNNMACYYRMTGKIRTALAFLNQALEIQTKMEEPKTLADTHLNLCAVLSQLERHEEAVHHSMLSVIFLQGEFLNLLLPQQKKKVENSHSEKLISDERLSVLAIAYHNLGVELQHLKQFQDAVKIYKKALIFSKDNLSNNEGLIKNLARVVKNATQQIQKPKQLYSDNKSSRYQRVSSSVRKDINNSHTFQQYRHFPQIKVNSMKNKEYTALISNYHLNSAFHPNSFSQRKKQSDVQIIDYNEQQKHQRSTDRVNIRSQRRVLSNRTSNKFIKPQKPRIQPHSNFRSGLVEGGSDEDY